MWPDLDLFMAKGVLFWPDLDPPSSPSPTDLGHAIHAALYEDREKILDWGCTWDPSGPEKSHVGHTEALLRSKHRLGHTSAPRILFIF